MTLQEFFEENESVAIAFSGGVDSAYLLYAGVTFGKNVCAYYVNTEFQPAFELEDAKKLASQLHANMKIIEMSALSDAQVAANPSNRCYYCKINIFSNIIREAKKDGFSVLVDGTNASDDVNDRPGFRALQELSVRSPLREAGLTKTEIRRLSKEAGLFTWNKPAYACLATRIPSGTVILKEDLMATEAAECALFDLGFTDLRVRKVGDTAKIQLPEEQLSKLLENREEVLKKLKPFYKNITLDLEVR